MIVFCSVLIDLCTHVWNGRIKAKCEQHTESLVPMWAAVTHKQKERKRWGFSDSPAKVLKKAVRRKTLQFGRSQAL